MEPAETTADSTNSRPIASQKLHQIIGDHPVGTLLAPLSKVVGTGVDVISFSMFLSRVSARIRSPFNLAIYCEHTCAEQLIASRIASIDTEKLQYVTTSRQLEKLASAGFAKADLIVVQSGTDRVFKHACIAGTRHLAHTPTMWFFSSSVDRLPVGGPTIALHSMQIDRSLSGFGYQYSRDLDPITEQAKENLKHTLLMTEECSPHCHFALHLRSNIEFSESLVLFRMLRVITALRLAISATNLATNLDENHYVSLEDYRVTRALLTALPFAPLTSRLSPGASETARLIFERIQTNDFQNEIPDHSDFKGKAFTRITAAKITRLSPSCIRNHAKELESEGVIESLCVHESNPNARVKKQGKKCFYRFVEGRTPPFGVMKPFECLPTAEEIATACIDGVQAKPKEE